MKLFLLLIFVLVTFTTQGQTDKANVIADTTGLNSFLKKFVMDIEQKDRKAIRRSSLKMIYCIPCITQVAPHSTDYLVPIDTFINQIFNNKYAKLLAASKEQIPTYNSLTVTPQIKQKELTGRTNVTIQELFFITLKPNEYENGHEGQSMAFQFVKIKRAFRFYGLDSVP